MPAVRIALLFEFSTLSGGERSMLAVVDQLRQAEPVQFVAMAPIDGALADELARRSIEHVPLDLRQPGTAPLAPDEKLRRLRAAVRRASADLIHANSLSMGRLLGRVAPELNCPATAHLRDIVRLSASAAKALSQLSGLVAVSHATRRFHEGQGVDPVNIAVIYNGVDLELFRPRPATGSLKRELGLPDSALLALNVGQICLRKGHDLLAQAAIVLADKLPQLHWVVCGQRYSAKQESREFETAFRRAFAAAGIAGRLHLLGYRTDVSRLMNEADVLVHAARQEPLGRVLLEAAASGMAIVATRVGGTEEILMHPTSGWLVAPGEPAAISGGVVRVLADVEWRQSLSRSARDLAETRFSIARAANELFRWWSEKI